jgi:pimeloyl-ACP methyl ester carboxylesterase
MTRRRRAVATLGATLLLVACSSGGSRSAAPSSSSTRPTTSTSEAPTTTTTVVLPPPAPLAWTRCHGRFDCARLTVPVDYADPGGPTLELAVIRRPAGDPAQRIGTLIMNPGGPGSSGVRRVQRGFQVSPEVARRFDIVGFDPRGIGTSTPISCGSAVPAFQATDLSPDTPQEQDAMEAAAKAVADQCAATEGVRLAHLGTVDVVRDLEVLRRDLGEPQASFVGLSYGTMLGLLWAEAYPSSVRAMVLDGVVDPSVDGRAISREQLTAVDDTLTAIDQACAADAGCPVTAAGGVVKAYDELSRRVEAGAVSGAGVGPTQVAYAFFYATYGSEHWPAFWQALADGLAGDLDGVASMARSFEDLTAYAPFALVTCLDAPHPIGAAAWRSDARRAARLSPRFGAVLSNELLPCAFWPQSRYVPHEVVAPDAPPLLVLGSTGDVATPYPQAVRVARALAKGVLLTIDIEGHVALGASDCATAAATRYLVDLTVPPAGTRC